MGIGLWVLSGVAAAALSRALPFGRDRKWLVESAAALAAAFLLGVVATMLDFGGWNEVDWRAGLFAGAGAFAVIGILRIWRLWR